MYTRKKFIRAGSALLGLSWLKGWEFSNGQHDGSLIRKASKGAWAREKGILMTRWSKDVVPDKVWPDYPRPQLARSQWQNLNGLWDYTVTPKEQEKIPGEYTGKILVPFCIESPLSGVMKPLLPGERLWYHREFTVPADWSGQRVLLNMDAVDWEAVIYIDGKMLGRHRGGYDAFSFDITQNVKAGSVHHIVISVWDPTDTSWQPHGKQTLHPGGCSYTAVSGIWQTVWLEPVPVSYIEKIRVIPDLERGLLRLTVYTRMTPRPLEIQAVVRDKGKVVAEVRKTIGASLTPDVQKNLVEFFKATSTAISQEVEISIPHVKTWSPEDPHLYDLTVQLTDDKMGGSDIINSYFGMRSVKLGKDSNGHTRLLLNGRPILMPGALDQGYWPDGVYLAPTDEALRFDIEWAKRLGLNTVRKHVKMEPQRWYYWADKLGLLVFQDMPTGMCGDPQTDIPVSPEAADQWRSEVAHHIENNINHPSIVCWTLFNEAFGGFDYTGNAAWAKKLDPTRLLNESSGFPRHGCGDVIDSHSGIPEKSHDKIGIISEDGTPSLGCPGHQWPHAWTYHSYDPATGDTMDFLAYYNKHPDTAVLPSITPEASAWLTKKVSDMFANNLKNAVRTGLSGDFYCQIVDVETECDGLMSYDREVSKVDAEKIAAAIRTATPALNS